MPKNADKLLPSWNDTVNRQAILEFVEEVTREGGESFVPQEERVAVFDNDGTLWCEKPMPIELGFILERLAEMARIDPELQDRQPWQAAYTRDFAWLGNVVTQHYQGDDTEVAVLMGGILQAFAGMTVDEYAKAADAFLIRGKHPLLKRGYLTCGFQPMIELLRFLETHGFTTYIASGGDRDFMRVATSRIYGIPSERVVGTSSALVYQPDDDGGDIAYLAQPEYFNDGPVKPVRIWSRIGRRPIFAAGNSNGDIQMLDFTGGPGRPAMRLLVLHDDNEREFDYVSGAEKALERAAERNWNVISVKNDWSTVFGPRS